jgi:hypothetical protein
LSQTVFRKIKIGSWEKKELKDTPSMPDYRAIVYFEANFDL